MADAKLVRIAAPLPISTGTGAFTNSTIDASTKGVAWLFQSDTADAITHLGFRYGARTGTPPTYVISLQSVGTASLSTGGVQVPSGTVLGGGSPASATFTPPADTSWDSLFQWVALTNSYTPAKGDILAACVEYSSGTVNGTNCSSFSQVVAGFSSAFNWPGSATKSTTWSRTQTANLPVFGYRTASARFGYPIQASYATNTTNSIGNRSTAKLVLPGTATYKVRRVHLRGLATADSAFTWKMGIWNGSGTELQAVTLDSDQIGGGGSGSNTYNLEVTWPDTLATLTGGTTYYVGLEQRSSGATAVVGLRGIKCGATADAAALPGGGNSIISTWNGSAWTDDDTVRPLLELLLEDVTDPAAVAGPSARNRFIGGGIY